MNLRQRIIRAAGDRISRYHEDYRTIQSLGSRKVSDRLRRKLNQGRRIINRLCNQYGIQS